MIELIHLKIIAALEQQGTLTAAANSLCLTQSALSHKMRYLEKKLGVEVWERHGRRLRLTPAGEQLLKSAQQILPLLEQSEMVLKAMAAGKQGVLRIGVECYPCYEWLSGIISDFLSREPKVDLDIFHRFQFSGLEGLLNRHIDLLITPDKMAHSSIRFETLFNYELVLLVSTSHTLADQKWVEPGQLAGERLITFPVAPQRLDILTLFLWPAAVKRVDLKQVESLEIMLQLVAYNRGICALPDWLAAKVCSELPLKAVRLGSRGITRELYATYRLEDRKIGYLQRFLQRAEHFAPTV
ncbi:MAG: LysR substrate-binding domain-containing protein [Candidatus Thiodiazotropha sp.]